MKLATPPFHCALALLAAVGVSTPAKAQQFGTSDQARAMLARAAAAVSANQPTALAAFDSPYGGFKDRDLYVFCFDRTSGVVLAGPATTKGRDVRTIVDSNGKPFGREMFANAADGRVTVVDYEFPKPGSAIPVPKESFVEGLGNIACGVGYYRTFTRPPGGEARTVREHHACKEIMGLQPPGTLYTSCVRVLESTLSGLDKEESIAGHQTACAQQGLTPGTASFAACVANRPGF